MEKIFKAMAEGNRRKILVLLKNKPKSVSEILSDLDISQSTLSCHLAVLKKAGLVKSTVKSQQRIYSINWESYEMFVERLTKFDTTINIGEIKMRNKRI